jgi:hypothetical protein
MTRTSLLGRTSIFGNFLNAILDLQRRVGFLERYPGLLLSWITLEDTPAEYSADEVGWGVVVNEDADALEFAQLLAQADMDTHEAAADPHAGYVLNAELTTHTADVDAHHALVTLGADADAFLGISGQALSVDSQSANTVLAGPTSGASADPDFRSLVEDDIPAAFLTSTEHTAIGDSSPHHTSFTSSNHTTIVDGSPHHPAVTLGADADVLLGISAQALSFDTQTANYVLAGPTSGGAADPTFRALVDADIPDAISRDSELTTHEEDISAHHAYMSIHTDAGVLLERTGQRLEFVSQSANTVLAGPTSGGSADPTFRALVGADLPAFSVHADEGSGGPNLTGSFQAISGISISFTPTTNEFAVITATFVVRQSAGTAACNASDQLEFEIRVGSTTIQTSGPLATGSTGDLSFTVCHHYSLTATGVTFTMRARNTSGSRGRMTADSMMHIVRIPR